MPDPVDTESFFSSNNLVSSPQTIPYLLMTTSLDILATSYDVCLSVSADYSLSFRTE